MFHVFVISVKIFQYLKLGTVKSGSSLKIKMELAKDNLSVISYTNNYFSLVWAKIIFIAYKYFHIKQLTFSNFFSK